MPSNGDCHYRAGRAWRWFDTVPGFHLIKRSPGLQHGDAHLLGARPLIELDSFQINTARFELTIPEKWGRGKQWIV